VPAWRQELRRTTLDPTAKLVGLVLSTYMDGAGRAQVSRSTLADGCAVSVSTVLRAVRRLERAGLLGVDRAGRLQHLPSRYQARSRGGVPATPDSRGSTGATPNGSQGWQILGPGVAPVTREDLRSSEGQDRGEWYGDPTTAELARDAAAKARRTILGGDP